MLLMMVMVMVSNILAAPKIHEILASSIERLVATKKLFVSFVVAKLAWNINTFDADDITLLLQSTNTNIMMVSKFVST